MPENPYTSGSGMKLNTGKMTMQYEMHRAWDEGFAAGRAAAHPAGHIYDGSCPDDTQPDARDPKCPACAAAHPDPPDMTNMCEGESPDHKPGITPAASPDERLREALTRIERLVARWDAPIRHDVDDRVAYEKWAAVGSEAHKIAADALAAADREAPDEGGGAMSEFRVVDANGDPYPPHAQPCRTLAAAALRRDFYQQVTSVSGEARMPVRPLRIERRSAVVSMWEPWNVGAASGLRKGASDE